MPLSETKTSSIHTSDRSLAAMIGKNTLFGIVSSGVMIGTRLITVPIAIHYLGLGGYGVWAVIMAMAAYMRFGSAGLTSAFQKYVAEATVSGDFHVAKRLLSTGSIIMLAISAVGLIPFVVLSKTIAMRAGVPPEFVNSAASSITVLSLIYVVSNFGAAFEAIVMGGNRIDLTRKFNTTLTICEAIAIIIVLRCGFGLLAMTFVMGGSELIYVVCCYRASRIVVPMMQISSAYFTKDVFPELLRFAGSYQLVNVLELIYNAFLPVIILKAFGARPAGAFAVIYKITGSALLAQSALVLPILSGATIVFTSHSRERIKRFLAECFKVTLLSSVPPLACVAAFGTTIILAWTGQADHSFRMAIWLCAITTLLRALSVLQLILYRASGRALLDNIRQVIRIVVIIPVALFSKALGFNGVLAGMAVAEMIGVIFMFVAMSRAFHGFSLRSFVRDTVRISIASAIIVVSGGLAGLVPIAWSVGERLGASIHLCEIVLGCLLMTWPALALTKSISTAERRSVLDSIRYREETDLSISE